MKAKRIPLKRIARLLQRHLRDSARGKKAFRQSGDALGIAIRLGVPLDQPITLPDGSEYMVRDQFRHQRHAKLFQRYQVVPVPTRRPAARPAQPEP
jgi:hypothetical protein